MHKDKALAGGKAKGPDRYGCGSQLISNVTSTLSIAVSKSTTDTNFIHSGAMLHQES
ncbi:MAG: hypothetical protein KDD36_05665 [Flavobacteriales bacterium]|nr:hypothetical protein [Flavobacteriales bacterium]